MTRYDILSLISVLALAISVTVLTTLILMVNLQAAFAQMGVNTILEKYYREI